MIPVGTRGWGGLDEVGGPPQLFCAPSLRCVEISERLVLLDVTEGTYDVVEGVGAIMWGQLLRAPAERDLQSMAEAYDVGVSVIETDIGAFAAEQQAAGRLVSRPEGPPGPTTILPRRRPTLARALRERAGAQRAVQRGFAHAYASATTGMADTRGPRVPVDRLLKTFRTADGLFPARDAPLDCLPRSLALNRFLRTAGWPAEHVIGVALHPFEAHAWVQLDDAPLDETPAALRRYTPIARA